MVITFERLVRFKKSFRERDQRTFCHLSQKHNLNKIGIDGDIAFENFDYATSRKLVVRF